MTRPLEHILAGELAVGAARQHPPAPPSWLLLVDDPDGRIVVLGDVDETVFRGTAMASDRATRGEVGVIVCGPGVPAARLGEEVAAHPAASVVLLPGAPRPADEVRIDRLVPGGEDGESATRAGDAATSRRVGVALPPPSDTPSPAARMVARARQVAGRDVVAPSGRRTLRVAPTGAIAGDTVVLLGGPATEWSPAYLTAALPDGAATRAVVADDAPCWGRATFHLEGSGPSLAAHVAATQAQRLALRHHADVLTALVGRAHVGDVVPSLVGRRVLRQVDVVVETRLPGQLMGTVASATPTGPVLGAALEALHRLASWTADRGTELAPALRRLVDALGAAGIDANVVTQLRADVDEVGRTSPPTVLVNGRPGPTSLVVHDGHRMGFADWRDAELAGPPVWDLTELLLRTLQEWQARRGRSTQPAVLARELFAKGDWHHRLEREVTRSCGELGFPTSTGWSLVRLALAARVARALPLLARSDLPDDDAVQLLGEAVKLAERRE